MRADGTLARHTAGAAPETAGGASGCSSVLGTLVGTGGTRRGGVRRLRRALPRCGFTLMEAIAAVVILAAAVPPALWALREAQAHRASAVLASRARWLAAEKLEDLIADRHAPSRGWEYVIAANYPLEATIPGVVGMSRAVTIAETGPDLVSPGTGYKRVAVAVSYTDARGTARTVTLTTVLTRWQP